MLKEQAWKIHQIKTASGSQETGSHPIIFQERHFSQDAVATGHYHCYFCVWIFFIIVLFAQDSNPREEHLTAFAHMMLPGDG